jgi:hypothetical protein
VQNRLRGWRLDDGRMVEMAPDDQGRLWSAELASWLVSDEDYLRLYDAAGQPRPTAGEAALASAARERAAKEAERAAKEAAWAKLRELGIDPDTL